MNYKNKLMGLSLILLAAFSACTDDVENGGRDSGTGDHRITFAVGTESLLKDILSRPFPCVPHTVRNR